MQSEAALKNLKTPDVIDLSSRSKSQNLTGDTISPSLQRVVDRVDCLTFRQQQAAFR
jgi:hypothetical protein